MSDNKFAIKDLENYKFVIPSYQRGYRWGEYEVDALLNDVLDYVIKYVKDSKKDIESNSFYCLQPIVVRKDGDKYNVIDGQQRLTTIFLILKYLLNKNYFEIFYQTRGSDSKEFLENIDRNFKEDSKRNKNMDFYHFSLAYQNIVDFFSNENIDKKLFEKTLLESCKVLWYEIQDKENDVFIRLNIGKIPLLPAENIKALFLAKSENIDSKKLDKRAEFWYKSEIKAREKQDFVYSTLSKIDSKDIMTDSNNRAILKDDIQRIEVYLRAICNENHLFDYFYKSYKEGNLNERWSELENSIKNLQSFASDNHREKIDREIFHYLGFLILSGEKIYNLYNLWLKNKSKEKFKNELFEKVKTKISKSLHFIDSLKYKTNDRDLKNILLLFNLEYLNSQEGSNEYFKFNRFQLEQWSLEHIYAQNSQSVSKAKKNKNLQEIQEWLKEVKTYIDSQDDLIKSIDKILNLKEFKNEKEINELFKKIDENFEINENLHKLQNLTLLDKASNAKIGNDIFSKKRKAIQILDEQDKLIPIATKKVFEKIWSSKKDNPDVFTDRDQEEYLKKIKEDLQKYKD
ncbi:DUF262 domain-containing protein [Helicobacter saguini]|uniref:DUF262 domain-containing protein n=1 Tax=Helicobacter saguini TaxID=1548018 RepID=A0A347VS66_9HELI|nr:DUF262 domain-containing protein [Helicobacter saguini]MWV62633.1 DUF262 domain-containing protein [Helicobacter saguini]MWV66695.1 DUF262 domain-containing protein [Helicobacter saguini]MWV69045.1 DUF262 domain-containing protein [Helicobacter saguini]MWV71401.1 DUF262 domain-containing protein [Helicobacter saguini]TLD94031.1 DUF262 domain-containing protein [Helicobacter saguini]